MASNDIFDFGGSSSPKQDDSSKEPSTFSVLNEVENLDSENQRQEQAEESASASKLDSGEVSPTGEVKSKGISALLQNKVAVASIGFFALIVGFVIFKTFLYQAPQVAEQDMLSQSQGQQQPSGDAFEGDNTLPPGLGGDPVAIPQGAVDPNMMDPSSQYSVGVPSGIPDSMAVFTPDGTGQPTQPPVVEGYTQPPEAQSPAPAATGVPAETPQPPVEVSAPAVVASAQPSSPAPQPPVQESTDTDALRKQLAEKDAKIKSLQAQLAVSKREYSKLASVSKKLLAKEKEMIAYSSETGASPTKAAPAKSSSVSSMYSIKAIVEGLAWLDTSDGRVITVRSGDVLAKNVSVTSIDPVRMVVKTSAGEIK